MIAAGYTPDVYTGNGVTTVFAYNFKIVDEDHIKVEELVIATGVKTTLTKGTHYTVSGVGEDAGGNITAVTAPGATKKWIFSLSIPVRQNTNFENQGEYFAEDHEDSFDLVTLMLQQMRDELDRTPKASIESGETGQDLLDSIDASVAAAAASATAAASSEATASAAATAAGAAQTAAETAQAAAEAAQAAAETAETNAETAEANAETAETNAETAATAAAASATAAAGSATTAGTHATNAATSATAAQTAETNAETAETNAETAQTAAEVAQTAAEAAQAAAEAAQAAAETAKTNAETAETNAETAAALAEDWAIKTDGPVSGGEYSAKYWAQQAAAGTTDETIPTTDNTTNNVSSTKHGWAPKSPADATKFLNGAATPAYAAVKDSDLALTDITTNDVSTSKHGFVPKAPNDAAQVLLGTGAWGAAPSSAEVTTLKNNLMRLAFQVQVADALSVLYFEDGISDVYTDQNGIDDTTSTNEAYNASGDYYTNLVQGATTKFDEYGSANASSSEPLISDGTFWEEAGQALNIAADTYITSIKFYLSVGGSTPNGVIECRIYAATGTVGSSAVPTGSVLATSQNVNGSAVGSAAFHEFTFATPYLCTAGDYVFVLHWTGDNNYSAYPSIQYDDSSPTHAGNYTHKHAGGSHSAVSGRDAIFELYGYTQSVGNMTLVSEAFTADAAPTTARMIIDEEDVDSVTINTDLTGEVSRDGGTTWSAITLALDGPNASGRKIYSGEVSVAGQPSGTSMKYRLKTFNAKQQRIHAAALLWK